MPDSNDTGVVDMGRRKLIGAVGAGAIASAFGSTLGGSSGSAMAQDSKVLRWGVVGTGRIANGVSPMIRLADAAELAAVSSRRMDTATAFAAAHNIGKAFDSWQEMLAWDGIDAVYVTTPTFIKEEICVAAANAGKHVLGEKPFANLASLQRITAACRHNGVGFMDGTHFVHHPRTAQVRAMTKDKLGWPWSVDSAFQFGLDDTDNIRLRPDQEPYGAIGDAGWYNMRAAVEFLSPDVELVDASAYLRRHGKTRAAISGSGVITFSDGSTTTWNCGFESGALIMDLRISAAGGIIKFDDFVLNDPQRDARYDYLVAAFGGGDSAQFEVPAAKPAAALMFEDFTAMAHDAALFEASVRASERTQHFLDASWNSAVANESA
jgi:predicted dehydrogenase